MAITRRLHHGSTPTRRRQRGSRRSKYRRKAARSSASRLSRRSMDPPDGSAPRRSGACGRRWAWSKRTTSIREPVSAGQCGTRHLCLIVWLNMGERRAWLSTLLYLSGAHNLVLAPTPTHLGCAAARACVKDKTSSPARHHQRAARQRVVVPRAAGKWRIYTASRRVHAALPRRARPGADGDAA